VPCFEYWLLLHFKYTTSPYAPTGNKSAADQVLSELKNELPNYAKAEKGVYNSLKNSLNKAKKYAQNSLEESNRNGSDNPSTLVHELVDYLQKIKEDK
jgi:S-ribosylhomocysteine lyase LuxS involved in autoinducer biosynthesis